MAAARVLDQEARQAKREEGGGHRDAVVVGRGEAAGAPEEVIEVMGVIGVRLMAAWLARDVGRTPVAKSAKFFGCAGGTMIIGLNRLDEAMESDRRLRQKLARIRADLLRRPGRVRTSSPPR